MAAEYLGIVELGGLYKNGVVQNRPTKPWRIGVEPVSGFGIGDIPDFTTLADMSKWTIGNTPGNAAQRLKWHKIKDGAKTLLICDRVILARVSWDDLNSQSLVTGKTITIDGQQYLCRLLTGGSNSRNRDNYAGGTPTNNEWDRFVTREEAISGLPVPSSTDLDTSLVAADQSSAHNQAWNWFGMHSWVQETYTGNSSYHAVRGFYSARHWSDNTSSIRYVDVGWRPVLEVLNSVPSVTLTSPADNQTLSEGTAYPIEGSATDADANSNVVIKCQINNGPIRNIGSGVSDGITPISFARTLMYRDKWIWDGSADIAGADLAENTDHVLKVWAEDDQGGVSDEVIRTFRVIWNRPPTISGQDENLGTISTPPNQTYSVTDPEGHSFTIEEYLDGELLRSFPGVAGQEYTATIPFDKWLRTSLAQHTLRIRATDSAGQFAERIYTFTRTDDRIEFTLNYDDSNIQNFFILDDKPTRILVTLDGTFPSGCKVKVEACNNALDDSPTWEDITGPVLAGRGYIFQNATKTAAQWAINIRITIEKGTAIEPVILNGFGGAFD